MKRKILLLIALLLLALTFGACGADEPATVDPTEQDELIQQTDELTEPDGEVDQPTDDSEPASTTDRPADQAAAAGNQTTATDKQPATSSTAAAAKPATSASSSTAAAATKPATSASSSTASAATAPAKSSCTISIKCNTILNNMSDLDSAKTSLVPSDGVILGTKTVELQDGDSVFDVLLRVCKDNKLHMEFTDTPAYNSKYIEGINNLYEFDCGELSGWMYRVNGTFPNYGCDRYDLAAGDKIEWVYTCDLGRDVGGENVVQK